MWRITATPVSGTPGLALLPLILVVNTFDICTQDLSGGGQVGAKLAPHLAKLVQGWGQFGPIWVISWGQLGPVEATLGPSWDQVGANCGPTVGQLGPT